MSKKKVKPVEQSWADKIELAVRDAIHRIPGLSNISEAEYCEAVSDALDVIKTGVEMRAQELEQDDTDE